MFISGLKAKPRSFSRTHFQTSTKEQHRKKGRRQDWQMWQKAHTGHSDFPSALALGQVTDSVQWSGRLPPEVRVGHVHLKARNDSSGVEEDSSPTVPTIPLPWTVRLTPRGSVSPNSPSVAFFCLSLSWNSLLPWSCMGGRG